MENNPMIRNATLSKCGAFRYTLSRDWSGQINPEYVCFICLNPSTADHTDDDPTVRRLIGYSKSWGYKKFVLVNLFAFRTVDPKILKSVPYEILEASQPHNLFEILNAIQGSNLAICAWGNHGSYQNTSSAIFGAASSKYSNKMCALKINASGEPAHPLYLKSNLKPFHISIETEANS